MCEIRLEHVSKIYQTGDEKTAALDDVSFAVCHGEFLAVTGPSGCGKSTLLHVIGGQQQKIAVGRALVNRPGFLLADEPTGNLDCAKRDEVLALIQRLNEREGMTVILVTHDPSVAGMARRRLRMSDGRIVEDTAGRTAARGGRARFDGTFGVLAVLAAVLVLLVCFCACVLLRNLYTVTLVQRQKSLIRLRMCRTEEKETGRECRTKEEETCRAGRASSPQAPVRKAAHRTNPSPQNTRAVHPPSPGQLLPVYGAGIPRGRPRALPEDHGGVRRGDPSVRSN